MSDEKIYLFKRKYLFLILLMDSSFHIGVQT